MQYFKSYGMKKKMFLFFFNYLKTETRKNSEKNYTNDVVVFFRKIFTPNLIIIKMFFFKQIDLLKKRHL